jgi:hypothetical protein
MRAKGLRGSVAATGRSPNVWYTPKYPRWSGCQLRPQQHAVRVWVP